MNNSYPMINAVYIDTVQKQKMEPEENDNHNYSADIAVGAADGLSPQADAPHKQGA